MLLFLVFWFLNLFVVWLFVDGVVFFYVFFISIVFLFVCFFTFASRESVLFVVFFNICFSVLKDHLLEADYITFIIYLLIVVNNEFLGYRKSVCNS